MQTDTPEGAMERNAKPRISKGERGFLFSGMAEIRTGKGI